MPLPTQTIPDQEDREFTTSTGHWVGDMEWAPVFTPLGYGVARFTFLPLETEKSMSLPYPHINLPPGKNIQFRIDVQKEIPVVELLAILDITDGAYDISEVVDLIGEDYQGSIIWSEELPPDWNTENTVMTLLLLQSSEANAHFAAADNASAQYEVSKPDYLPILGVH
jgi:hypothetical protein